jgi:hypothetical protein
VPAGASHSVPEQGRDLGFAHAVEIFGHGDLARTALLHLAAFSPVLRSMMRRLPISGVIFNERGRPMATINVTVTAAGVSAVENPQAAKQTETVTWVFTFIPPGADDLRVVFKKVELSNNSGVLLIYEQGPFSRPLSMIGNQISGTIAQEAPNGRYLYDIHDGNNKALNWVTKLSPEQNFGGLDIPKPPPKG